MVGYMADFQSSVCDISATTSVLSSSTARLISAAFRRCFDDSFATDFMDDREDYGEQRLILFGMVEGCIAHQLSARVTRVNCCARSPLNAFGP